MTEIDYTENQKANDKLALDFNSEIEISDKFAKVLTGEGFICFKPCLDEVDKNGNYRIAVAFPEGTELFKQIKDLVTRFKKHVFGDKRGLKLPIKSGKKYLETKASTLKDEGADDEEIQEFKDNYGHLAGCWYINMTTKFPLNDPAPNTKRKPNLLGPNMAPIESTEIEGTDIVRVKFGFFSFDREDGKGISLGLRACQLLKKGSWEGGDGADNTDGFAPVPVTDGEEESTAGLEPVEEEAPKKKKPVAKKSDTAKKIEDVKKSPVIKKTKPAPEPEEEEDDYADDVEGSDTMTDDEVFEEE